MEAMCAMSLRWSPKRVSSLFKAVPNPISRTQAPGGGRAYDALLLDAGGTLLQLAEPVEDTYASIGRRYGLDLLRSEVKQGFRRAFKAPWPKNLRYQNATLRGKKWKYREEEEKEECRLNDYLSFSVTRDMKHGVLMHSAVKLAVISNFDTRLRKLLKDLNVAHLFDAIIISSEVGYEKPAAEIFRAALDEIDIEGSKAIHVGDDQEADKMGANAVGIDCWLWGMDVKTFAEIQERILKSTSQNLHTRNFNETYAFRIMKALFVPFGKECAFE
ncbi:hypothetical protein QJS04_geneDACA013387 [Acorus gramineus]|uniref:Haloacid dehalogenase-like hydrolase domain-containing protein 3 n=1 Tax=Acorus gramineus TaxID=55184 RepID=A0AAV9A9U4_ACOGR|nr:hypothetical protein QJS04_geneDACA013387 [Acorus gramineus]